MNDTLFLINPGSGRKKKHAGLPDMIRETYRQAEQECLVEMIDFSCLDDRLDEAIASGIKRVFAVGGDGTINAVGTRLINRPAGFGLIPAGSGNGFGRNVGFSIKPRVAIEQSLETRVMRIDTAEFGGKPFINVAGVGLAANITENYNDSVKRGLQPYVQKSTETLFKFIPEPYQIDLNGETHEYDSLMEIAVANGTQWGFDTQISPHSSLTDGWLDIIVVRRFSIPKSLVLLPMLFMGRLDKSRHVTTFKTKEITIHRTRAGNAHIDGEPIELGPEIYARIHEKSLDLLLPQTLTEERVQDL